MRQCRKRRQGKSIQVERMACAKALWQERAARGERDSSIHSLPDVLWLGKGQRPPGFCEGRKIEMQLWSQTPNPCFSSLVPGL